MRTKHRTIKVSRGDNQGPGGHKDIIIIIKL